MTPRRVKYYIDHDRGVMITTSTYTNGTKEVVEELIADMPLISIDGFSLDIIIKR